jgi:hypothetical protein
VVFGSLPSDWNWLTRSWQHAISLRHTFAGSDPNVTAQWYGQ